ncbi:hypothetical protein [Agarivorans sp. 1_MG-2023]|uniref:hypothetical protein n=1 Tax=Agarivorans sp. 1_MG-2023 TaxID=3062634 RepID=UPI0026E12780|nr:hypothetical protein [Agarivorans sp. 1_MG-2023]MDO6764343.1 hypothetical protein [Agarivorans sp. 1_MG-2023]
MTHTVKAKEIGELNFDYQFSICTLVTDLNEYQGMLHSFSAAGFTQENSQFIYADNSVGNKFDAYQAIRKFITHANAEYLIICHQDVLLDFDNQEKLSTVLQELNELDPNWALCGNAGYVDFKQYAMRISDPHDDNINIGSFPKKVKSLDENFIVVKKNAALSISKDLSGFHLYGTDMCILANILGFNAYVIDFHLRHNSGGNINQSFDESKRLLLKKYHRALKTKYIRTTCTKLIITNSNYLNQILNRKIFYSLRKRIEFIYGKLTRIN